MAGAGYKLFNTGDVLLASEVNTYLQQQVTMVFANSTARTTALSAVLAEGMMSYLQDTNTVEVYNGTSWVNVGNAGDITEVQAGTGISIASGTGPIPVVTNTVATEFDAKGDLIVGTGADTFDRLAVGTNGYTLVANSSTSTGLEWVAPASGTTFVGWSLKASGLAAGTTSCANATATRILFDAENFDTDGFHSTTTNTARVTIPTGKGGYYLMNIGLEWDANGTGQRQVKLYKNGSALYQGIMVPSATVGPQSRLSLIVNGSAGDYFEIFGYQESGGALNCYHTDAVSAFNGSYLGA